MPRQRISEMEQLMRTLSPLPRMINSRGLDRACEIIRERYPDVVIHEYPCGTTAEDWEVPQAWECVKGTMTGEDGAVIASTEECPLFVAPYSEPVDGWFTKDQIQSHLRTRPDRPDAFALEHRNAYDYQLKDWGITLPHNRWESLPQGRYHLKIDVEFHANSMKAVEWTLKGQSDEIICLNAHIDELCNDDLSGCVVGLEAMRSISAIPDRRHTYQILLTPELIGTLFFIHNNPETIRNTVGMLNLEALGDGEKLCLKRSMGGNGYLESVLGQALAESGIDYGELGFFEGYGNDERVYGWPTIGVPGVALQRYPFARYHTSEDTPDNIDYAMMEEAVRVVVRFAEILEKDAVPVWEYTLPPWLTKRGLYFDRTDDQENFQKFNNIVLFNVNGENSVINLASLAGMDFGTVRAYLDKYMDQGCMRYRQPTLRQLNQTG